MRTLRLGHSPDSDDAFMFWGLASERVQTPGLRIEHILKDIQTLNEWALEGKLEITALSAHTLAMVSDRYAVMAHGASMGDGYGPKIVCRSAIAPIKLSGRPVAIPGKLTSAFLAFRLWWRIEQGAMPEPDYRFWPFDRILEAVANNDVEAGVLIHEGQLTYASLKLQEMEDLGAWWKGRTGLPLPLGLNAVRRDLPDELIREVCVAVRDSIEAGLVNRQEALRYALQYARGLDEATADRFVGMYVNEWTLNLGPQGEEAVRQFLVQAACLGLLEHAPSLRFVSA